MKSNELKRMVLERKEKIAFVSGLVLVFAVTPAAAQSGACGVPNASNGISTFGQLIRGVLVLVGVGMVAKTLMDSKGGGTHGKAGSRKTGLAAVGLFFVGAGLPQLSNWMLGLFGSSLADVGLSCMF